MTDIHVVGLSGSAGTPSNTATVVQTMLDELAEHGATTDHIDLAAYDLPLLDLDREEAPENADEFTARVGRADAIVVGTPMYHGSYSGVLKNAIDYCGFDEIEDTDVAIAVVAGGQFPRPAVEHLRTVLSTLNARVLPRNLIVPNTRDNFTEDGEWANDNLHQRTRRIARELYDAADQ